MESSERLWSISEASLILHMSKYGIQKILDRNSVNPAIMGNTRNGGYRYKESDLRRVFGTKFSTSDALRIGRSCCRSCGKQSLQESYTKTHGLCLECWCRELNKYLIGRRMRLDDAVAETTRSLKEQGVIE